MTDLPLVTVNIPTYNQERYVARAIESALAQDYPNLEIVVADDCSSDATFEVARRFAGPQVRVERNARNLGRVANYRRCLYELARGDWVVNLDGDDQFTDAAFISTAIAAVGLAPGIVMYAAGSSSVREADGVVEHAPMRFDGQRLVLPGTDYVLAYPNLGATQHFAVVYDRRAALETDFYSIDALGADTDSLMRLALKGKVVVEKRWVGMWTHHAGNASYAVDENTEAKEVAMLRRVADALAQHVPAAAAERWLRRQIAEKERFVLITRLATLPLREAWPLFLRNLRPNLQTVKEAAKLVLRSGGLR